MEPIIVINSLGGGGSERQVLYLLRQLPGARLVTLETGVAYDDVPTARALSSVPHTASGMRKLLALPVQCVRMCRYARRDQVVVSFLTRANIVAIVSSLVRGHRVIVSERQALAPLPYRSVLHRYGAILVRRCVGLLYRRADMVVVNSEGIKDDLVRYYGVPAHQVTVIYNICDADRIRADAAREVDAVVLPPLVRDHPYIVTSGRLDVQKGQWSLLRAYAYLRRTYPSFAAMQLVVLGTGPLEHHLRAAAARWGVADTVHFLGFVPHPFGIIARARACIMPSVWEGFPNVVLESFALGTPVVAADCRYGLRELLAPETSFRDVALTTTYATYGILVPPVSPHPLLTGELISTTLTTAEQGMVDALVRLETDNALRASYVVQGPVRVAAYASDRIGEMWRQLIRL